MLFLLLLLLFGSIVFGEAVKDSKNGGVVAAFCRRHRRIKNSRTNETPSYLCILGRYFQIETSMGHFVEMMPPK